MSLLIEIIFFAWVLFSGVKIGNDIIGLSIFDVISLILFLILPFCIKPLRNIFPRRLVFAIIFVQIAQFLPLVDLLAHNRQPEYLYALRFTEYFLWLAVGASIGVPKLERFIPRVVYIIAASIFVARLLTGEGFGVLNYSWEAGAIGCVLIFYIMESTLRNKALLILTCSFMVVLSGQRTQFGALIFGLFYWIIFVKKNQGQRWLLLIAIPALVILPLYVFVIDSSSDNKIMTTTVSFLDMGNFEAGEKALDLAKQSTDYENFVYEERSLISDSGDLSFQLRLRKWAFALNEQIEHPLKFLYGLGPGFFGGAADSSVIRAFFETGLFGMVAWYYFFRQVALHMQRRRMLLLIFLLNCSFIDILFSSKLFVLLLIIVGAELRQLSGARAVGRRGKLPYALPLRAIEN